MIQLHRPIKLLSFPGTIFQNVFLDYFLIQYPNIDIFHINDKNEHTFRSLVEAKKSSIVEPGKRFLVAKELIEDRGYEKVIVLGADTITCAYLSEFLDLPSSGVVPDIIATFDYDYPLFTRIYVTNLATGEQHLNADVVCFNGVRGLDAILKILEDPDSTLTPDGTQQYGEQAALNEVFYNPINGVTGAWAESLPSNAFYYGSNPASGMSCYNVRSKSTLFSDYYDEDGNRHYAYKKVLCQSQKKPWKEFIDLFTYQDGILRTGDGRQIKVWHYCEGFGCVSDEEFNKLVELWKYKMFNEDTKKFFRELCGCGFFFPEEV